MQIRTKKEFRDFIYAFPVSFRKNGHKRCRKKEYNDIIYKIRLCVFSLTRNFHLNVSEYKHKNKMEMFHKLIQPTYIASHIQ